MKWVSVFLLVLTSAHVTVANDESALIVSGDCVVLLGGTFVERMQIHGYLEAEIVSRVPDVKFRNLGWSGDNVWGESRAVFGSVDQGFDRLLRDMRTAAPTVIIVCYGANEAHQGTGGLKLFEEGLSKLLDALSEFKAKIILMGPRPYERLGPPLPDPAVYNRHLALYTQRTRNLASDRDINFIDLAIVSPPVQMGDLDERSPRNWRVLPHHEGLTGDGLHLTANGYRTLSSQIAMALNLPAHPVSIVIGDTPNMTGGKIVDYHRKGEEIKFSFRRDELTLPQAQMNEKLSVSDVRISIHDLRRGKYVLIVDDQPERVLTSAQLREGVVLSDRFAEKQAQQLRYLIVEKNMLFFHRHRPQNETYLFLFRKHEQGNNAVEIPQFDPLIGSVEKLIGEYAVPKLHKVGIQPVKK